MTDFLRLDQSPIHQAAAIGDIAVLSNLLAAGHDINAKLDVLEDWGIFCLGLTPLMLAACSPRGATADTLRWLIEHGAYITLRSTGNVTAAWYAAGNGVFFLQTSDDVPSAEQVERLRLLLQLGADPNETADNGRSLLVEACRAGDSQRVSLLLDHGVLPEPVLESIAPQYRRKYRKNSVSPLSRYQIPLFCAVSSWSADCVQLLITAGADVNRLANNGATALMYACKPEIVQLLIDAGADTTVIRQGGWDTFQEILKFEAEDDREEADIVRSLQLLIHHGADIHATQRGANRLYQAAFSRNPFAIARLLKLGATPTAWRPLLSALTW
nr:ankyrin repeat domain-containing protein [Leptolyngbyaceae cyanobacterium MAG.088]